MGHLDGPTEVVIVTGASRGIGLEACRRFSQIGARVGMIARSEAGLRAASELVGSRSCAAVADVAEPEALAKAMAYIESELGPPTVLVNNAGHGHWSAVVDTELEAFRHAIEVNYLGAVHATSLVLAGMLRRGRGHIVNVASIAGRIGAPFESAYSASKFALVGYTEALAVELAGSGVGVSLIDPGPVDTAFAPELASRARNRVPRPIRAGVVADAIVAAADKHRSEQFLPRWLRLAFVARVNMPGLYRAGTRRMYATERRALREMHQQIISTRSPD